MLKQSLMVDSLLEIMTERESQKFYKPTEVHFVINVIGEIEVSMIFIVAAFFCGWVVNKLKGMALFPDRMNRNHLDLILGRHDRSCCTMENLRYLLCCKRNILIKPCRVARTFF